MKKSMSVKPKSVIKKRLWNRFKQKQNDMNIVKIVKRELSRNIENKQTYTHNLNQPVCHISYDTIEWSIWSGWYSNIFALSQGAQSQTRIGNKIKLKRWVIKGMIHPQVGGIQFNEDAFLKNSYQGYLTVYFGTRRDGSTPNGELLRFYNNGATAVQADGHASQSLYPVNKDHYKIYWSKKFKMSPSYLANSTTQHTPNNDFACVRTFGFDVCKHILKNKIIHYDDETEMPKEALLRHLALWAVWTPAMHNLASPFPNGNASIPHYYQINLTTYAEYEDA